MQKTLKTIVTKFFTEMDSVETTPETIFEIEEDEIEQEESTTQGYKFEPEYIDQDYDIPLPEFDSGNVVEEKVKEIVAQVTDRLETATEKFESVTDQPEDELELTTLNSIPTE